MNARQTGELPEPHGKQRPHDRLIGKPPSGDMDSDGMEIEQ